MGVPQFMQNRAPGASSVWQLAHWTGAGAVGCPQDMQNLALAGLALPPSREGLAVVGVEAPHQLVLVEAERDRVIGLPLPRWPDRPLPLHDPGQAIEVGHHVPVDTLVEGEQPSLVS